jgi:YHS domain-containing protein
MAGDRQTQEGNGKETSAMKKMAIPAVVGILIGAMTSLAQAHCGMCPGDLPVVKKEVKETTGKSTNVVMQTTCPVMGGAINKALYADHDGKRVYFCCGGCSADFKKDPAKYIKKLEDAGVTVAKVQTTCPVMGGKIDKTSYVDVAGKRIYLCCAGCADAVRGDPEKYIKKLEGEGVTLDVAAPVADKKK